MPNQTDNQNQLTASAELRLREEQRLTAMELDRQAEARLRGYVIEDSVRREQLMHQYPHLNSILHDDPLVTNRIFATNSLGSATTGTTANWSLIDVVTEPQKKPDLTALEKLVNEIASHLTTKGNDTDLFYANRIKQEFENARQF